MATNIETESIESTINKKTFGDFPTNGNSEEHTKFVSDEASLVTDSPSSTSSKHINEHGDDLISESMNEKVSLVKEHDAINEEKEQANKIKEELDKELEENDGWIQILGNDQIMKKVIKEGIPNTRPQRGDICKIRYSATLKDNDSNVFEMNDNYKFQLGDAEVIVGLDMAIPLMCKGEQSLISVSPRFGYGQKGCPPKVPPNAWLMFTVELLEFEPEKELSEFSVSERREIGNRKRERGNWWYGRDEAAHAVQCYRRAIDFLDDLQGGITMPSEENTPDEVITEEMKLLIEDRLKAYNNMAAAQLKMEAFNPALKSVDAVLRCQPDNVKALFRKAKILSAKGETADALNTLRHLVKLDPENKPAIQEINRLSAKRKEEKQNEQQLYKRMFNTSPTKAKTKGDGANNNVNSKGNGFRQSLSFGLIVGGIIVGIAGFMAYRYSS